MTSNATERRYFAAANTRYGFRSRFDDIFGQARRRYIIKGGPGTGKSRLMREIADEAVKRGLPVEYFYCSSDTFSLDGIIIGKINIAVFDGTAPHACDVTLPAVRDELINLGEFWDTRSLAGNADEIRRLNSLKGTLYASAYRCLAAAGNINDEIRAITECGYDTDKLNRAVARLTRGFYGGEYSQSIRLTRALSVDGDARFTTFADDADTVYSVTGRYCGEEVFYSALLEQLKRRGCRVQLSFSPLDPNVIDAVYLPDDRTAFVTSDNEPKGSRRINLGRFRADDRLSQYRARLKFLAKCRDSLFDAALDSLAQVKPVHAELETLYGGAMDFIGKEAYTKTIIEKIFTV